MNNIDFLTQILTTTHEYWIVERTVNSRNNTKYDIIFICIPYDIPRGINYNEIKLIDLKRLREKTIQNVYLSNDYTPFQWNLDLSNIKIGFPLKGDTRSALKLALTVNSDDLFVYKKLMKDNDFLQE